MTGNWIWVPYTALGCYLYLLLSLLAAKKNRAIQSFIILLCAMTCWTEGSLMMRLLSWPGYEFWYHASVFGLLFTVYSFYYCVSVLVGVEKPPHLWLWLIVLLAAGTANAATGCFVPAPAVQLSSEGGRIFIYEMSPAVVFLFLICLLVIGDALRLYIESHADQRTKKQLIPLFVGYGGILVGHLLICVPVFAGIPFDILSGIFNALCIFRVFRKKHLVRLTLLLSRNNCYLLATGLTMLALFHWFDAIEETLLRFFPQAAGNITLLISAASVLVTLIIYEFTRFVIDRMFVWDETVRAEKLREFCFDVSQSLNEAEILGYIFRIILNNTPTERVYACMLKEDGYHIYDSSTGEVKKGMKFSGKLVTDIQNHPGCMSVRELERMNAFYKISEEERRLLKEKKIGCLVPLGNDGFAGFLALRTKSVGTDFRYYRYEEIAFLESVESIASMALKNAELYEEARIEARTDMTTGILNRRAFYEILDEKCAEKKTKFSLLLINLDDFKLFNQLYGVSSGDTAIRAIAQLLAQTAGKESQAARYGGKEFAVILPDKTAEEAERVARRLMFGLGRVNTGRGGLELNILTASCGICSFPDGADTAEALLTHAEMAVYHVKQHGKNDVMIYREGKTEIEEKGKEEIYSSYASAIFALTAAIDTKDHYTFNHSKNVAYYATRLALLLNKNSDFVEVIREAALLHDIGKIGIPEDILNKPGRLTDEEYKVMQSHVESSIGIIRYLPSLNYVIPAVICHHERYDGKGYPRRIAGTDIPLSGRILCIADSFDAMVSRRSYKEPYPLEKAISIIIEEKGAQFDPELADVFVEGVKAGNITVQ